MAKASILGSHWRGYFFSSPFSLTTLSHRPALSTPLSLVSRKLSAISTMDDFKDCSLKKVSTGLNAAAKEEYASQSKLLEEFIRIPNIDKAWVFNSENSAEESKAMFAISQPNLVANKTRKFMISAHILKANNKNVNFHWAPFPVEMTGVSIIVPSPSGTKLLAVRNPDNDSPVQIEIWGSSQVEKEFKIPQSIHGSLYVDGWFEGISWNHNETLIAYVAEEPPSSKPVFTAQGFKEDDSADKDCNSWKGKGDWEEEWGETYAGKRQPALFIINIDSGEVRSVKGINKCLSVGQVVWAPSKGLHQCLVFVGWPYESRKLGIKYCYNRPCALYAVKVPDYGSEANEHKDGSSEDFSFCNLTESINSAYFPRFSPDGNSLVFLSAKSAVDSGAHSATNSLHRIDWSTNDKICPSSEIISIIPIVMCADDGCFPGLYTFNVLTNPWLSDGSTMIISSIWRSREAILSVNILSGEVLCISPAESNFSWHAAALDGDCVIAVTSSIIDLPQIKYGVLVEKCSKNAAWNWFDISSPISRCSEKVRSLLSSLQFSIINIPVKDTFSNLTKGACNPFEAIFVSSHHIKSDLSNPLIVILHGGPHSVSLSSFSKSIAFLTSIGFNLLIVNYRGSLGFGEEALQSLPGKVGSQDVNDVLTAIDHIIDKGLADPSKIAVLGGSHGGFLTTHLIGQAPEKFVAAAARNPVCNLTLMVGTTDIPDWCYVEAYGSDGKNSFTESPSMEHLAHFYCKSPISHLSKVKTPTLFLLSAQDLRVPYSNGLQYARALKEKGVEVKIIIFPDDVHSIDRPQSDFESFLNIGVWFKKYCN